MRIGNKLGKNTDGDVDIVQNALFAWLGKKNEVSNLIKYIALDQYQNEHQLDLNLQKKITKWAIQRTA